MTVLRRCYNQSVQVSTWQKPLIIRNIKLGYGGIPVVDNFNLTVTPGEIHALAGENGAGKTTVLKAVAGLITQMSGSIEIPADDREKASRVGFVLQHDVLPSNMTLGACVACAALAAGQSSTVDSNQQQLTRVGLLVPLGKRVSDLTMHQRQLLQVACALASKPALLLLDEPTSVMSHTDAVHFWTLIQAEVATGLTVIIATHKLEDILEYCSHVTVMRSGELVFTRQVSDVTLADIISGMAPPAISESKAIDKPEKRFSSELIVRISGNGAQLDIHENEIHGLAGLDGSGYTSWLKALALTRQDGLSVTVRQESIDSKSIATRRKMHIGYIPADRHIEGMITSEPLDHNMTFGQLADSPFAQWLPLQRHSDAAKASAIVDAYDVRPRDVTRNLDTLSGGNQQKFMVGRELERNNEIIVIDQPTRGLDRAASAGITRKLLAKSLQTGTAILVYSDDLTFLINTCDTISVVSSGQLVQTRPSTEWTEKSLVEAIV
jgi:simple sugar transport system ATP-binding protein